jgi:hypothetical protein
MSSTVFEFPEFSNSSTLQIGEEPKMPVPPMEGNCLTNIIKDTPPITNLRVLDSDDDLVDKVNDIWMDINLDGSLSGNSVSSGVGKLIIGEEKLVQTENIGKVHKTSLRHFRKTKNSVNINTEKPLIVQKQTDMIIPTASVPVKNKDETNISIKSLDKEREIRKSLDLVTKHIISDKLRKRAKSVELDKNSNHNQEELLKEFKSLKRKRSIGHIQDEIEMLKSSIDELRNLKNNNVNNNINQNDANNNNNDHSSNSISNTNVRRNASLPMLPDTKTPSSRNNFSSVFNTSAIQSIDKNVEEVNSKQCVDSDIKIQLPNMKLQIKDKKEMINKNTCTTTGSKEAIKIEINVSRIESQYSYENEIVNKSNQHLNISLPSPSPTTYKVDCKTSKSTKIEETDAAQILDNHVLSNKEVIDEKISFDEKDKEAKMIEESKENENTFVFMNTSTDVIDGKCFLRENNGNDNSNKKDSEIDNVLLKKLDKKESDIENAIKKLDECRRDGFIVKDECFQNKSLTEMPIPGCSKDLDFDNFDVEPFDDKNDDYFKDLLISADNKDHHRNHNGVNPSKAVGYFNPLFHLDELENLNTVPVYTTKDGKITYSPNPNYTYRALIIEARQREGHFLFRNFYDNKISLDKRNRYYSSSKSQDEISKFDYNKRYGKTSYHKYKFDGKKERYNDETCLLSFENCAVNECLAVPDKAISDEIEQLKPNTERKENVKKEEEKVDNIGIGKNIENHRQSMIIELSSNNNNNNSNNSNNNMNKEEIINLKETEFSPISIKCSSALLMNECAHKSLPMLEERRDDTRKCLISEKETDSNFKTVKRCIVDLQNLKDDILKKLNDEMSHCKSQVDEFESHTSKRISLEIKDDLKENENQDEILSKKDEYNINNVSEIRTNIIERSKSKKKLINLTWKNELEDTNNSEVLTELKLNQDNSMKDLLKVNKNELIENLPIVTNIKVEQTVISEAIDSINMKMLINKTEIKESPSPIDLKIIKNKIEILESVESIKAKVMKESEIIRDNKFQDIKRKELESADSSQIDVKAVELTELIKTEIKVLEPLKSSKIEKSSHDSIAPCIIENKISECTKTIEKGLENMELIKDIKVPLSKKDDKLLEKEIIVSNTETNDKTIGVETMFSLPCSINKSSFSSELCDHFIKQEKLYAARADAIVKTVPKLVIRKTDTNPKFFSKTKSIDGNYDDSKKDIQDIVKSPVHPKIPKMIIRNARSRPTTPSIEEISEISCSSLTENEPKTLKVKIKLDDKSEPVGHRSQNSSDSTEAKIPKMKIKLEENLPRVVIENIDLSSIDQQKTVPKMKITNVKGSLPKIMEKQFMIEDERSDSNSSLLENDVIKIKEKSSFKVKVKKGSPAFMSTSESSQKRSSSGISSQSKKTKRSPKEEIYLDPNLEDAQFLLENEYKQKNNSNSCCSNISTKIPKVIIKRTSPSAEFKCELSKEAIVNAQPQVVLRRSWVLDCMAKDLRHMKLVVKVAPSKEETKEENKPESNELQWERFVNIDIST